MAIMVYRASCSTSLWSKRKPKGGVRVEEGEKKGVGVKGKG
jgi:hypothetical protein